MEKATIPEVTDLDLNARSGQVLCFGWQATAIEDAQTLNAHARELVEEMQVGGVVLLARNLDSANSDGIRATLAHLQSLSRIPLFIAIDQEGGTVNRLRAPFHEFPGNMALGATGNPELAFQQAQAQARELLALGINWNFAPVMDVNNNPDNPIIGVRSYGADPELVAQMGTAAIRGYQQTGILACAKHFPGHGDTAVDSHLALPTIWGDRERLEQIELVPFRSAIAAGVGAIMTTHIVFPALDAHRPATISPAILKGLLRQELGYDGLVITDCLEMKAIADTVGTARGAVEALKAGADMVLIAHTLEVQREAVEAIRQAVESGNLSERRLTEAASRVLSAKRRFLASLPPAEGTPWFDPAHDALEEQIARASLTVVKHHPAGFPLRTERRTALISAHHSLPILAQQMRRYQPDLLELPIAPHFPSEQVGDCLRKAKEAEQCVIATSPPEPWSDTPIDQQKQAGLVKRLHERFGSRLIVVALREPYDIRRFPFVQNYLCTYGFRQCSLGALADALYGTYKPTGRLPVEIPL
ncbi:MAG: beta-N-acetylhexosaminidase [Armatimonadota bacterium]